MGGIERDIVKQAVRSKQPIPDRILNAPTIRFGLDFFLQAFFDLDSERAVGFGLGRIPWHSIRQYADEFELEGEYRESLFFFIHRMDTAYLNNTKK